MNVSYLLDKDFLKRLDLEHVQIQYVRIIVLDKDEKPIETIEGKVSTGSISKNGTSSVRRTANFTFFAEEDENDLTSLENLLSVEKRIAIFTGLENFIDSRYDDIIWFPQGIYIITQPNLSHSLNGVTISLSCQDKMALFLLFLSYRLENTYDLLYR